jgi:hypothetical protein
LCVKQIAAFPSLRIWLPFLDPVFYKKVFHMLSLALEKQNVLFWQKMMLQVGWDVFKIKLDGGSIMVVMGSTSEKMYDEDIHTTDASIPIQVPISGPITRARARQLNHQVITLLSSYPSYLDHGDPCTLVLLRNQGEDRKGKGFEHAGFGLQKNTNLW